MILLSKLHWNEYEKAIIGIWILIILPMIAIYLWATIDLAKAYFMEYKQCRIWWDMITDYEICQYFCNYYAAFDESIKMSDSILSVIHSYYSNKKKNDKNEKDENNIQPQGNPYVMLQNSLTYSTTLNSE